MNDKVYLAIDLGAGSGRLLAGRTDLKNLDLEEVHRFENPGTNLPGGLVWNVVGLYREIIHGLKLAVARYGERIQSLGIDTWGVDFALTGWRRNVSAATGTPKCIKRRESCPSSSIPPISFSAKQ